ncbi:hypothetical protein [Chitinophaga sp.]|uniref:hypothetical protein n=1 Tax=Chitinophaga sp. TaxID=1869181 RepID=UPI0031D91FE8
MTIKCKGFLLNRMIVLMMIGIGLLAVVLFFIFPMIKGYLYFFSMVLMFTSLIYIFYLNRFELLVIGIEDDELHLSFVNNSLFKRKDIKVKKEQVKVQRKDEKLIFLIDGQQQAIVRKKALDVSDWEKLLKVFEN